MDFLHIFTLWEFFLKKFYNTRRWKFLIAIDSVLNLELTFCEDFFDWLDFHIACPLFKKKIKQQNHYFFFLLIILLSVHI